MSERPSKNSGSTSRGSTKPSQGSDPKLHGFLQEAAKLVASLQAQGKSREEVKQAILLFLEALSADFELQENVLTLLRLSERGSWELGETLESSAMLDNESSYENRSDSAP